MVANFSQKNYHNYNMNFYKKKIEENKLSAAVKYSSCT